MEQKLRIEVIRRPDLENRIFSTVGIGAGLLTKYYQVDSRLFVSSFAFCSVLFHYWQIAWPNPSYTLGIQRGSSTVSFSSDREGWLSAAAGVFKQLLRRDYSQELFEQAKQQAKENYRQNYRAAAFRARLKAYEFSDLGKWVRLSEINRDLDEFRFEDFRLIAETLLVPGNLCLCVTGDIDPEFAASLQDRIPELLQPGAAVSPAGFPYDPLLRQDANVLELARESAAFSVLSFGFLNSSLSVLSRQLILEVLSAAAPMPEAEIFVDRFDSSILFPDSQLLVRKENYASVSETAFDMARERILKKYQLLLVKDPQAFSEAVVSARFCGFSLTDLLSAVERCTCQSFQALTRTADFVIALGQVVMKKENAR